MTPQLKLYIPDDAVCGDNHLVPARNLEPPDEEETGPPPETREVQDYRRERQKDRIEANCPDPKVRKPLLEYYERLETLRSLGVRWNHDWRTVGNTIIPRELERIRTNWIREISALAVTGTLNRGVARVCPWKIEAVSCGSEYLPIAEVVVPGVVPTEAVEQYVRGWLDLLMGGPPNRLLGVTFDSQAKQSSVAVYVHRRHAVAVAQRIAPAQRRAA